MENSVIEKMEKIKLMIQYRMEDKVKVEYLLSVDDLTVVSFDSDLGKFDRYKEFVTESSKKIRVVVVTNNLYRWKKEFTVFLNEAQKPNH